MGENPMGLYARLLTSEGSVYLDGKDQKLVWVEYPIALDHLALQRLLAQEDAEKQYRRRLAKALSMDPEKAIHPIYTDQLAVLEIFLPAQGG
jgi:hypothetical protein